MKKLLQTNFEKKIKENLKHAMTENCGEACGM